MNPIRRLTQNDASFKTINLPHNKKLLRYKLYLDYAVDLLKTTNKSNVMEAIEVILYILKDNKLTKLQTDCLYHLAVGFLKLNDYHNATIYCQCLLTIEPDNQRIKDLLLEIKSRSYEDIQNKSAIVKLSTSN
uniref:TPR_REGION domain-containing protein n=1 Tax=Schistosoma mansoni TaxID=6183 RepID=A0A5K4F7C4_SCHMA